MPGDGLEKPADMASADSHAIGNKTQSEIDAELKKGMDDIREGRVLSADEVEKKNEKTLWHMKRHSIH